MRLALLTGGSRGLGLALCNTLTARGFRVVEFSRTAPHAYSVRTDLSAPAASRDTIARAITPFTTHGAEPLTELVVINNAGLLEPIGPASAKPREAVLANLNANYSSAILFITEVVAQFQAAACRKVVANISSGAAQKGYAGWSLYCAAKAGVENFIRALAVEQVAEAAPFVAVNINPGVMDTEMQALIRASSASDFPEVERFVQRKQSGELAPASQVAEAVLRIVALPSLAQGERYDVAHYRG